MVAGVAAAKAVVWDAWADAGAQPDLTNIADDVVFHGPAPLGVVHGREALVDTVYRPLAAAFGSPRREPYLFLGGIWDTQAWVATTGNLTGTLVADWIGLRPTGAEVTLRFGEFYRVLDGRVVEIRCLYDIVGLAAQCGHQLLPPVLRPELPPGPSEIDGLNLDPQDPDQSQTTLHLIEDMLAGCNRLIGDDLVSMGMAAFWHDDMAWYGPSGVGTTRGFDEFQAEAQGPSVASFPNRRGGFHQARIGEGLLGAFTGWPSLQGTFDGEPFRGIAPTGGPIGQNIMDFYVRRGDRLHENWVLIDLIDFAAQCGVDLLERLPT